MMICESRFKFYILNLILFPLFFRLRLKKLKDEMRNEELGSQSDDTFNEVIRDFARNQIIAESNKRT